MKITVNNGILNINIFVQKWKLQLKFWLQIEIPSKNSKNLIFDQKFNIASTI